MPRAPIDPSLKRYSVAVRPTEDEVKRLHLYYDKAYYEDRMLIIYAHNEQEAIQKYIQADISDKDISDVNLKKGEHIFLRQDEMRFIRAKEVKLND